MFKLVVLSALVAFVAAKPSGLLHSAYAVAPVAYSAPVVTKTVVSPSAVSSTYRKDVISEPAYAYAAPAVAYEAPVAAYAPAVAYSAPVVTKTVVSPAAVSSSYRRDVINTPALAAYAAPTYAYAAQAPAYAYASHAPVVAGW